MENLGSSLPLSSQTLFLAAAALPEEDHRDLPGVDFLTFFASISSVFAR